MGGFIYFTEEQKQRANAVDLEDFLSRQGEKLLRSGREKRLASDHSITVRGNQWYDHATEKGGCSIDFVRMFYNQSFPDAVTMLLGGEQGEAYRESMKQEQEPKKPFILPEANRTMHRAFAYLVKTRCLDPKVVSVFARRHMIYEDAKYHNTVFVGFDVDGIPRHAHKRGTCQQGKPFKGNVESCDPRYSFHWIGKSDTVYVFEAPIDMWHSVGWRNTHWYSFLRMYHTFPKSLCVWIMIKQESRQESGSKDGCLSGDTEMCSRSFLIRRTGMKISRHYRSRRRNL